MHIAALRSCVAALYYAVCKCNIGGSTGGYVTAVGCCIAAFNIGVGNIGCTGGKADIATAGAGNFHTAAPDGCAGDVEVCSGIAGRTVHTDVATAARIGDTPCKLASGNIHLIVAAKVGTAAGLGSTADHAAGSHGEIVFRAVILAQTAAVIGIGLFGGGGIGIGIGAAVQNATVHGKAITVEDDTAAGDVSAV